MANITDFRVLSFDIYGTVVDWESGVLAGLQPLLDANKADISREDPLNVYHELEVAQQTKQPDMKYSELLSTIHPQIAARLGLPKPTVAQNETFGQSIGRWPAFSDSVDALKRLGKHYKLVALSNVDRESFATSNAGVLQGVKFDLVITAQDVGSYKPDRRNFEYMLREVHEKFGASKEQVLQTAQSQFHDHHPAREMGIKSSWIVRPGASMGNREKEIYDWRFDTLGEMADVVEKA
ncbi:hypothetical protein SLS56_010401 [Neofusicoccum ribis]|uniref:Haloacid dehalogenase n=1 Tax=Neofusicoccum ribis TaxID=45134 RepID=A0ABR3SEJ9_9PEZI